MKLQGIVLVAFIGFATPAQAASNDFDYPEGDFSDKTWAVQLTLDKGEYKFTRTNLKTKQFIFSTGATKSGDKNRQIYTWKKDGYSYKVTYRPNQLNIIRLQIYYPTGQPLLNRLLYRFPPKLAELPPLPPSYFHQLPVLESSTQSQQVQSSSRAIISNPIQSSAIPPLPPLPKDIGPLLPPLPRQSQLLSLPPTSTITFYPIIPSVQSKPAELPQSKYEHFPIEEQYVAPVMSSELQLLQLTSNLHFHPVTFPVFK